MVYYQPTVLTPIEEGNGQTFFRDLPNQALCCNEPITCGVEVLCTKHQVGAQCSSYAAQWRVRQLRYSKSFMKFNAPLRRHSDFSMYIKLSFANERSEVNKTNHFIHLNWACKTPLIYTHSSHGRPLPKSLSRINTLSSLHNYPNSWTAVTVERVNSNLYRN